MSTTNAKQPTHRVYAVSKYGEKKAKSFWQPIGAAWAHEDNEGFTLRLDLLPLNGADIVLRKPKDKDEADHAPA